MLRLGPRPDRLATLVAVALTTAVAGCSHQPPSYSWSHADSGEYLFAFDARECDAQAYTGSSAAEEELDKFFDCMQGRGYYLVDPASGEPLAASSPNGAPRRRGADIQARN